MLVAKPEGNYRYLPSAGEAPFCSAVIADAGYEIVRATFETAVPYRRGFELIEAYLRDLGRPRQALCAVELRCAEPYTPEGFRAFNADYAEILPAWGLSAGAAGTGTTARTNIAPVAFPPREQVMTGFAYTVPSTSTRPTFVVSGATGGRVAESLDATRQRVANIVQTLTGRLEELQVTWAQTTEILVYAPNDLGTVLETELLPVVGTAVENGVRWLPGRAPVLGGEVELGTHGVLQELRIPVTSA
jgi:hypothetical protein